MSTPLVKKVQQELKKVGLEFQQTNEFNGAFKGKVLENGKVVLKNLSIQKSLQWNSVVTFANMVRKMVDDKRLLGMID